MTEKVVQLRVVPPAPGAAAVEPQTPAVAEQAPVPEHLKEFLETRAELERELERFQLCVRAANRRHAKVLRRLQDLNDMVEPLMREAAGAPPLREVEVEFDDPNPSGRKTPWNRGT